MPLQAQSLALIFTELNLPPQFFQIIEIILTSNPLLYMMSALPGFVACRSSIHILSYLI